MGFTILSLLPHTIQNSRPGQGSPQTTGQRWPHFSSFLQRSLQGILSQGAPHGSWQEPCKHQRSLSEKGSCTLGSSSVCACDPCRLPMAF